MPSATTFIFRFCDPLTCACSQTRFRDRQTNAAVWRTGARPGGPGPPSPSVPAAMAGRMANAAVVGILAAALYDPVFTAGITGTGTLAVAAAAFVALRKWKTPPWAVVVAAAAAGAVAL